jgi:hypothetical protein
MKKVPRIGYLSSNDQPWSARAEAPDALRELGCEGQNIATEYRYAEGKVDGSRAFGRAGASQAISSWRPEGLS